MNDEFAEMPYIEPGEYEHYKGKRYEVLGIAAHSETLDHLVVYKPLHTFADRQPDFWVRPYGMFVENVEINGETVPRFKKVAG